MRARRETIRQGSSKTKTQSVKLELVRQLHMHLKREGARNPGAIALTMYSQLEAPFMARWSYAVSESGLDAEKLARALQMSGYPEN